MTALIKSTDGSGWVEARSGDVVIDWMLFRQTLDYPLNNGGWMFTDGMFTGSLDGYQLIERPFMVDDPSEYLAGVNFDEWFPVDWENGDKKERVEFMNKNPEVYRHSSPLLRPVEKT